MITPTPDDIAAFNMAMAKRTARQNQWNKLPDSWTCPSCHRSKFQIIRYVGCDNSSCCHNGWCAQINAYFCQRFPMTWICCDCRLANGIVKWKLQLDPQWNFSPSEMRHFVKIAPHSGDAEIDYDVAREIYFAHWDGYDSLRQPNLAAPEKP